MCLTKELRWNVCEAKGTVYFYCRSHIAHTLEQIDTKPCPHSFTVKELLNSRSCQCAIGPPGKGKSGALPVPACTRKQDQKYYYFEHGNGIKERRETKNLLQEFLNLKRKPHRIASSSGSNLKDPENVDSRFSNASMPRDVDFDQIKVRHHDNNDNDNELEMEMETDMELEQVDDHRRSMFEKFKEATERLEKDVMLNQESELERKEKQTPQLEWMNKKVKVEHNKGNNDQDEDEEMTL